MPPILRTADLRASSGEGERRVVVPFHSNATLHPKIVNQVFDAIEEASIQVTSPE